MKASTWLDELTFEIKPGETTTLDLSYTAEELLK